MSLRFKNNVTVQGQLTLGLNSIGQVNFANNTNLNTVSFKSGVTGASFTYTLPITAPTLATSFLLSDTAGTTSWSSISTAPTFAGIKLTGSGPFSVNINSVATAALEDITTDSFTTFQSLLESHASSSASCPIIAAIKSRGTAAAPTAVLINDAIGFHNFFGYTGNSTVGYQLASQVQYWICQDGTTVSTTSMPGRIQFFTTPDLSTTPNERMRINCKGTVTIFSTLNMAGTKIYGDSVANGTLTIAANSNDDLNYLIFGGTTNKISVFSGQPTITASQNVMSYTPSFTIGGGGVNINTYAFNAASTITIDCASGPSVAAIVGLNITDVVTHTSSLATVYTGVNLNSTITSVANAGFASSFTLFNGNPTLNSSTAGVYPFPVNGMFSATPSYGAGNVNVSSSNATFDIAVRHVPTYSCTGASSAMTFSSQGFANGLALNANTAGSVLTCTSRRGFYWKNFTTTATGTIAFTENVGIDLDDQTASTGNLTVTAMRGIRSALSSGTGRFFIYHSGTCDSAHTGNFRLGDTSAPGALLDLVGKFRVTSAGIVNKYNNVDCVAGGIPSIVGTIDLATQSAAIGDSAIITPSATGMFRISVFLQVTRAATTSSILGGATGVVIKFNDGNGNVAQVNTMALATTAGAIAVTAAGNTTTTNLEGTMVIYARTGVVITYAVGYTSVGVTAMQYSINLKLEAM